MKIEIPKIVRPLDLGEYDEALRGQRVYVWVNPTREVMRAYARLRDEGKDEQADQIKLDEQLRDWFAKLWSHGPADTSWTADELLEIAETDPAFAGWLILQTWQMIGSHSAHQKKA